ncbi:MAG: glycosyltransferase family 39 protein [Alphaproteobacteria bacterium]|nr:glycosyltransferase family 39 protein [Alphaproteobacteria bacterium]
MYSKSLTLWMIVSIIIAFYFGLTSYDLLNNNEGLYAQIPFEMLQNKSFVIPTLNTVPYIEKPPMVYWLIAGSYALLGKSVLAARLVPATFGMLTALGLLFLYARLGLRRQGIMAAILLSSSLGFAVFSRMVFFDVVLTAFFTFALLSFYLWFQTTNRRWLLLFYAFLGGAVLTKGLLPLVLAGIICLWFVAFYYRTWQKIFQIFNPLGIAIFMALTVPWHWMAHLQLAEFSWFYFVNEHVLRFLDLREPRDYYHGPWYYYLIRLPGYVLPWTLLLPLWGRQGEGVDERIPTLKTFAWIWFLITLAFFTISRAKANYYMVLGLPPLIILLIEYGAQRVHFEKLLKLGTIFSVTALITATFLVPKYTSQFSAKSAVDFLQNNQIQGSLYYYKQYERLSSFLFYWNQPIPIVDSVSSDLYFGSKLPQGKGMFLSWEDMKTKPVPQLFIVHPKDASEFENKAGMRALKLYADEGVGAYKVSNHE